VGQVTLTKPDLSTKRQIARALKVKKAMLMKMPFKGNLSFAISKIPGGKHTFLEFARMSENAEVKNLVAKWDSLKIADKQKCSIDDLCNAMGMRPLDLLKEVTGIAYEYNTDLSNFIAAVAQPRVVEAGIKKAMKPDGVDDRRMLHQHSGFIPSPKGPSITVNASAQAAAAAKTTVQGDDNGLPDFEQSSRTTVSAIRGDESTNENTGNDAPAPFEGSE
jgi:hypothetical protein